MLLSQTPFVDLTSSVLLSLLASMLSSFDVMAFLLHWCFETLLSLVLFDEMAYL